MSEWQTIDTAPKDGTKILVINGNKGGYGGACGESQEAYSMGVAKWYKGTWVAIDCCDGVSTYKPTHWQPLPAPPKVWKMSDALQQAKKECDAYARLGGLTRQVVLDIAHDTGVDRNVLLKEFDYEWRRSVI